VVGGTVVVPTFNTTDACPDAPGTVAVPEYVAVTVYVPAGAVRQKSLTNAGPNVVKVPSDALRGPLTEIETGRSPAIATIVGLPRELITQDPRNTSMLGTFVGVAGFGDTFRVTLVRPIDPPSHVKSEFGKVVGGAVVGGAVVGGAVVGGAVVGGAVVGAELPTTIVAVRVRVCGDPLRYVVSVTTTAREPG
jgi:hypothetical protein